MIIQTGPSRGLIFDPRHTHSHAQAKKKQKRA
jgi:hypothetical protein